MFGGDNKDQTIYGSCASTTTGPSHGTRTRPENPEMHPTRAGTVAIPLQRRSQPPRRRALRTPRPATVLARPILQKATNLSRSGKSFQERYVPRGEARPSRKDTHFEEKHALRGKIRTSRRSTPFEERYALRREARPWRRDTPIEERYALRGEARPSRKDTPLEEKHALRGKIRPWSRGTPFEEKHALPGVPIDGPARGANGAPQSGPGRAACDPCRIGSGLNFRSLEA
jgi:hypothetical protein